MDYNSDSSLLSALSKVIIVSSVFFGLLFSILSFLFVRRIRLRVSKKGDSFSPVKAVIPGTEGDDVEEVYNHSESFKIYSIYEKIRNGAFSYIKTEYFFFIPFLLGLDALLILLIGLNNGFIYGALAGTCFITGAFTSLLCGAVGMAIATYANARTTISAQKSLCEAYQTSFRAAQSFGFFLPSVGIFVFFLLLTLLGLLFDDVTTSSALLASFGLGGSISGLFARVCGGIFTKAADVGADMVGKVENNINEDDARNPAVIADNVGDNVGDIAGMGADLFGSFAECMAAALIIISNSATLSRHSACLLFPMVYLSVAIIVAIFTSFFATKIRKPTQKSQIESSLKYQILIFSVLMILISLPLCLLFLPRTFNVAKEGAPERIASNIGSFFCVFTGIAGGALVGLITEYYTSHSYRPVREVAESSNTGAPSVIIYGLSLGYRSTFLPVVVLAAMMFIAFYLAEFFGVIMMALGLLALTSTILTIDAYGPICDNAGGIAEMAELGDEVRERTDTLDAAGNTTAAIGKGFAICLAYIVGVALLISFVRLMDIQSLNILNALPLFGIALGACFPFYFSAHLNKSVGHAAGKIVDEVRRQFKERNIIGGNEEPDYDECIKVATRASLRQTVFPFVLTLSPIVIGFTMGDKALASFVFGVQAVGVPVAISSNNMGGAWDNAKKYIEAGNLGSGKGKNSECHRASVVGDTVGDPMKDTSGPSINTLLKVVAVISLVFSSLFPAKSLLERAFNI